MQPKLFSLAAAGFAIALAGVTGVAQASDWHDLAVGYRTGNNYREPFNANSIHKDIFSLTYVDGSRYGGQFFNADVLKSDHNDPASIGSDSGALEVYVVYRYTLDLGKLRQRDLAIGPIKRFGLTAGFDWNHKNDIAYNSRKRMLVLGPSLGWNVPGFLNTSLLLARESNFPEGPFPPVAQVSRRYTYDMYPILALDWGIPVSERIEFSGFANFIAAKGKNETGGETGAETNIVLRLLADVGSFVGARKKALRAGIEYQYWNNKFGNTEALTGGDGYRASTPMLRVEYHF